MILVTGGTGLVGSHLLYSLLNTNTSVKATYRNGSDLSKVEKVFSYYTDDYKALFEKIIWVKADINNIPALETAFDQITQVYHCAALISFDPKAYDTLHKINVEGTTNIVNLCIAKKIEKLCYVSSIATIGRTIDNAPANEETEWNDTNANVYAITKYDAEMEVWRGIQENISAVIVNPGVILGSGFWTTGSGVLFKTAAKGRKYYPPGGTGLIAVSDVVKMMIQLMNADIKNERFIAVNENLTYKEILTKITKKLEVPKPTTALKFWQLEILRRLDGLKSLLTNSERRLTKDSLHGLKNKQLFSNHKITKALNFKFETMDNTLDFSCEQYKKEHF